MKKSFAFTLGEVLLTMSIIGVISGMMIISLNNVNPDKDKVLFLKTYHSLELAVADTIRDGTKYDQNAYADSDFSTDPLPTAEAFGGDYKASNGGLNKDNAFCMFLAEQFNIIGGSPNCGTGSETQNFRASNGACFHGLGGAISGSKNIIINPQCKDDPKVGYVVTVYKDGRLTVPETSSAVEDQAKAYKWMLEQTKMR